MDLDELLLDKVDDYDIMFHDTIGMILEKSDIYKELSKWLNEKENKSLKVDDVMKKALELAFGPSFTLKNEFEQEQIEIVKLFEDVFKFDENTSIYLSSLVDNLMRKHFIEWVNKTAIPQQSCGRVYDIREIVARLLSWLHRYDNNNPQNDKPEKLKKVLFKQVELNKQLYDACLEEIFDSNKVKSLLEKGADPLGTYSFRDTDEHIYGEILMCAENNIYTITKLFLEHGMIIKHDMFGEEFVNDNIDPLWMYALGCMNEDKLKALKLLLDYSTDIDSIMELVGHLWDDFLIVSFRPESETLSYAMKSIMLVASYPYMLDNDEDFRNMINYDKNNYDISKFRDYSKFSVQAEKRSDDTYDICFYDENNEKVWTF